MRIGILTAGGDCPGLNAVIRSVVRCASADAVEVLGFRNGYLGLFENDFEVLTRAGITGILPRGGTILGTSRFDPEGQGQHPRRQPRSPGGDRQEHPRARHVGQRK